ncbi:hypothetical protein KP509_12G027400 [Ceratopteris richardii]|uniref:PPM-type phosphatase domain-containing protein n=1 Tax=Ceratopteris richardii TaxID=49495 RepID=A0A8T2THL9_CERRI|nr:hypothetical protein KP509_12G027400 [Ceratopteris richardii]
MDIEQDIRARTKTDSSQCMVPLAALLKNDFECNKGQDPIVQHGLACHDKKGEDHTLIKLNCQHLFRDGSVVFSVFGVFDGHNGASAAIFSKEKLLQNVLSAVPTIGSREEWLDALPRALVSGFIKTDIDFQEKGETSGTTATLVIVDRWTVTVAAVGDSRCVLDASDGGIFALSVDHRFEENAEERKRVMECGGEVCRLSLAGGAEIGPLRCWPGGLCLSRSIGDVDVGAFIVPIPHVKQIQLPKTGGRLIIASDGLWDALSIEKAAKCCRGLSAELAAKQLESLRARGLRDDTTCLVVDLLPPLGHMSKISLSTNRQNNLKAIIARWRSKGSSTVVANKSNAVGFVEEIFEAGSAKLADRLGTDPCLGVLNCAICQVNMTLHDGISVHAGSVFSTTSQISQGPFLCLTCKAKKDAMEGRPRS